MSMYVYEVDKKKAIWLAMRADAHDILKRQLNIDKNVVRRVEEQLYTWVVQEDMLTSYHMVMYKELMGYIIMAPTNLKNTLVTHFYETMPQIIKSFTSHISQFHQHTLPTVSNKYPSESKQLFYEVVRPKLMAMATTTKNDLPPCTACKTNEYMTLIAVQTRSGDEAATIFPKCMKCQKILTDSPLN